MEKPAHVHLDAVGPEILGERERAEILALEDHPVAHADLAAGCLGGGSTDRGPSWRQPPTLETDATAAERGGAEPFIVDAVKIEGLPSVTVHAFDYPAGRHTLEVRGTGTYLILGIVKP